MRHIKNRINAYIKDFLWNRKLEIVAFDKKDPKFIRIMNSIRRKTKIWLYYDESYNLYSLMERGRDLGGEIAEVGVADGASALILAEMKGNKELHLFDTFEGLSEYKTQTKHDLSMYNISMDKINRLFSGYKSTFIHKGIFPKDTGDSIGNKRFSLVHLDVNLYQSAKDSLEFFWPRMVEEGAIILHDYNYQRDSKEPTATKKAVDEFCKKKKILPLELRGTHICLIR